MTAHTFRIATASAPWGPVRLAVTERGLAGLAVRSPIEPFATDVARRTGLESERGGSRLLDRAVAAVEAFLDGRIPWLGIAETVDEVLQAGTGNVDDVSDVLETDRVARERARKSIANRAAA